MSFSTPSTYITLDSGTITMKSGDFRVKLYCATVSGFSTSYTLKVKDMEGYEFDMDATSTGSISSFKINVPEFTLTLKHAISDGTNIHNLLELIDNLSTSDLIICEIIFNSKSDFYYTTKTKIESSKQKRSLKLTAQHPLKYGQPPVGKTWDNAYLSSNYIDIDTGSVVDGISTHDLISKYLEIIGTSSNVTLVTDLYSEGTLQRFAVEASNVLTFSNATDVIKSACLAEGAVIGTILGESFYFRRSASPAVSATLTGSDVKDFDVIPPVKNFKSLTVRLEQTTPSWGNTYSETLNVQGTHDANVTYNLGHNRVASFNVSTLDWEFDGDVASSNFVGTKSTNVINSFKRGLNTAGNMKISGKIKGITTLKPNETFTFSGVDDLADGNTYRFSYFKPNFKTNYIEFEGYKI